MTKEKARFYAHSSFGFRISDFIPQRATVSTYNHRSHPWLDPTLHSLVGPTKISPVAGKKLNLRLVLIISVLALMVLLSVGLILVGYAIATQHAIGIFAPLGHPTNFKLK